MYQDSNNSNENNFNTYGSSGISNNQPLQGNQNFDNTYQQSIENKKQKKKKYWLIPVKVLAVMVLSQIINMTLLIFDLNSSFLNSIFSGIFIFSGFAFLPSIIIAIILSVKNKK